MQSNQELQASTPKPSACRNPVYNPMQIAPTPRLTTDALIPTHTYADDKKSYYLTEEDLALRDSSRSSNHEVEKQNASDVAGLRAGDLESDMHMVNRSMSPLDHALAEAVFTPEEMRPPTATSQVSRQQQQHVYVGICGWVCVCVCVCVCECMWMGVKTCGIVLM
jgi:hypothetical protein